MTVEEVTVPHAPALAVIRDVPIQAMKPEEDQYFPRTTNFHLGSQIEEVCPQCGHVAKVSMYYAPDIGRNWLHCTNPKCKYKWV